MFQSLHQLLCRQGLCSQTLTFFKSTMRQGTICKFTPCMDSCKNWGYASLPLCNEAYFAFGLVTSATAHLKSTSLQVVPWKQHHCLPQIMHMFSKEFVRHSANFLKVYLNEALNTFSGVKGYYIVSLLQILKTHKNSQKRWSLSSLYLPPKLGPKYEVNRYENEG